jgi:hypothetical protein
VLALLASLLVFVTPASAAVGLHVSGTRILEANGNNFIMRGVSHPHVWFANQTNSFADIKSFGTNTVRVVLGSGQRWGPSTDIANVIALCKQNRLICVLEVHDTTGFGEEGAAATLDQAATYWISQANALRGQENYVVINIGNEPFGNNAQVNATWATATTYRYNVRARDTVPNFSASSGTVSVTTQSGGGTGTCRVSYSASNWGGGNGFTASVTVTNTGTATVNGWTLAFAFPAGQRVTPPGWAAVWTQASGSANVTATNLDWNGTLTPGGATQIGFNGTHSGANTAPTSFTLNGNTCQST